MEIYLIRHTKPSIEKGICYGQSDIGVCSSFEEESFNIKQHLPEKVDMVYSSPLKRCRLLACYLFPKQEIKYDDRLKEMSFGEWEMQPWDLIDQQSLQTWMNDFVNTSTPNGESYEQLYQRTTNFWVSLTLKSKQVAIVTHAGVIRSILSKIGKISLQESFQRISIPFGCIIKIYKKGVGLEYEFL
jgi:alpha-ribazole phosphatase